MNGVCDQLLYNTLNIATESSNLDGWICYRMMCGNGEELLVSSDGVRIVREQDPVSQQQPQQQPPYGLENADYWSLAGCFASDRYIGSRERDDGDGWAARLRTPSSMKSNCHAIGIVDVICGEAWPGGE